jgi:phosphoglycolate phosphatase-like HAD superfamily hydrolase
MLVLDFDGVVCDALDECALVTWHGVASVGRAIGTGAELLAQVPTPFVERFRHVRNYSRLLDHFFVAHQPGSESICTQNEFDAVFGALNPNAVQAFVRSATTVRDSLRDNDGEFWLGMHTLYPGMAELMRRHAGETAIVTAKDKHSVWAILRWHRLEETVTEVIGECSAKVRAVERLAREANVPTSDITFIDDNLTNVVQVGGVGARAMWALWGYQIPEHRVQAEQQLIPTVELEDLESVFARNQSGDDRNRSSLLA